MIQITDSLGIIVLNPESDPSSIRITARTAQDYFPKCPIKCIVGSKNDELAEIKKHCPVVIGGKTISSLIDAGLVATKQKWCLIITSGTFLRNHTLRKHQIFCTSDKEVLYPVIDRKWMWDDATLNGMLIPTRAFEEVGPFGDTSDNIRNVKLLWGLNAISKGYKFKALVGARLI